MENISYRCLSITMTATVVIWSYCKVSLKYLKIIIPRNRARRTPKHWLSKAHIKIAVYFMLQDFGRLSLLESLFHQYSYSLGSRFLQVIRKIHVRIFSVSLWIWPNWRLHRTESLRSIIWLLQIFSHKVKCLFFYYVQTTHKICSGHWTLEAVARRVMQI